MTCSCKKKRAATQPKKIVKSPSRKIVGGNNGTAIKRILRRAK